MRVKFIFFLFSFFLLQLACQNSAEANKELPANDPEAKAVLNQAGLEIKSSRSISPENFEKLKAVYEKYPDVKAVKDIYKAALIIRDDLTSLENFLTEDNLPELSADDRKNLARLYIKNGKYEKASEVLNSLIKENPNDVEVRGLNGLTLFNLGKLDEAGKEFDSVWDAIVKNKMAEEIATRGIIYYRQNNMPKAVETLEKALAADPGYISANYTLSRIYAEKGDTEKAEFYRKKTDEMQDRQKAETFAKSKAVKLSLELQKAWQEKRYQEVINLANQMLPTVADKQQKTILYQYLFESYKALGQPDEAEKARQAAQKLNTK